MASSNDALLRAELRPSVIREGPPDGDISGVRGVEDEVGVRGVEDAVGVMGVKDEVGVRGVVGVEGVAIGPSDDEDGDKGMEDDETQRWYRSLEIVVKVDWHVGQVRRDGGI